jgi:hypothetical protein
MLAMPSLKSKRYSGPLNAQFWARFNGTASKVESAVSDCSGHLAAPLMSLFLLASH